MKVRFNLNNGANIHSNRASGWLDTVDDLGLNENEWEEMTEEHRYEILQDWANEYIEIWYEEKE